MPEGWWASQQPRASVGRMIVKIRAAVLELGTSAALPPKPKIRGGDEKSSPCRPLVVAGTEVPPDPRRRGGDARASPPK